MVGTPTTLKYYSVNSPISIDTTNQSFAIMKRYDYSFQTLQGSDKIGDVFGFDIFPTIVAIKNDTVRYLGSIELFDDFLNDYLKNP